MHVNRCCVLKKKPKTFIYKSRWRTECGLGVAVCWRDSALSMALPSRLGPLTIYYIEFFSLFFTSPPILKKCEHSLRLLFSITLKVFMVCEKRMLESWVNLEAKVRSWSSSSKEKCRSLWVLPWHFPYPQKDLGILFPM